MLTKEQAVCLTAMTGTTMLEAKYFMEEVCKKLGRNVHPAEFNNRAFLDELKNLYYDEFIELCWEPPNAGLILPTS